MAWNDLTNPEAWKLALANLLRKGEDVGTYISEAPEKAGKAIVEAGQRQSALMNKAFDPTGKTLIRDPQAANQAAMNLLEGPLGFMPAGIMIGPSAATWNKEAAFKAAKMEKAGKTPQEIWEATGTARGLDNNWRQEIPDNLAVSYQKPDQMDLLNQYSQQIFGKRYGELPFGEKGLGDQRQKIVDLVNADLKQYDKIGTSLKHPELYKSYDDLQNIDLFQNRATSRSGEFNTNKGNPYIVSYAPNESELKSNLLHELQHGIQLKESWGLGGSPEEFLQPNKQKLNDLAKQLNEMALAKKEATPEYLSLEQQFKKLTAENPPKTLDEAMEMYKKLSGEAEARLVQNRMNLTPEERVLNFPFKQSPKGLDIDPMEAIIRLPDSKEMITRRQLLEGLINKVK